jgi:hypothetical protein
MGGYGSGRTSGSRDITTSYRALDVRWLQRNKFLIPGRCLRVTWFRNGEPTGNIDVRMELSKLFLAYKRRSHGGEWQSEDYPVGIDFTPCHYGGERAWFLCPARGCRRRVAILYGGGIFACRHCHRLAYESQTESPAYRALSRTQNIRVRLGGSGSLAEDFPDKPKGMHWRKYRALLHQANVYEQISNEAMMSWLGAQSARIA